MPRIFINYRRDDSAGWVTAIYNELIKHYERDQLFRDIDTIDFGVDFVAAINDAVQQCDVLLAIIGPQWCTITDAAGRRRLDNPNDFVRLEIAAALSRDIRVIPVLVGDAAMPYESELPENIRALSRRNGLVVGDRDFAHHMERLLGVLTRIEQTIIQHLSNSEAKAAILHQKIARNDFDVFLCHNSGDKPAIREINAKLKEQGLYPWLDEEQLQPGLPWQRTLEEQIGTIKSAAVFVGENGHGPWQDMEINAFLREFVSRDIPVIPVILADCLETPDLPIFLHSMTWVDFRKANPDPMQQLIWGITGKKGS